MDESPTDDDKKPKMGKLLHLPSGSPVDTEEVGVDSYVASPVGNIPMGELMDPREAARELQERMDYVGSQELVKIAKEHAPTAATIDVLLIEIAEEVSHMKWERRQNAKKGKSTAQLTIARIAGLKQLSDILIKRKETSLNERLTTKDPRVQKLFEIWMEMFFSALEKSKISPEVIDIIFAQIRTDMLEWETKMESVNA